MKSVSVLSVLAGSLLFAGAAFAEGGYYSGPLGGRTAGRAGAVTAKADDLSAVSYNPAGLANMEAPLFEFGNQASYNAYAYTRASTSDYGANPDDPPTVSFGKVSNGKPLQGVVPMLGFASKLGMRDWGFALAAYAPPGISTLSFPQGGGNRYMMLDREAIFLKYVASAAWKYHDVFGIGASAEWIHVPRLVYSLVIDASTFTRTNNPVSSALDMVATMKGSSLFTFNATLGAWYRPVPSLTFGLSGQVVPANIVTRGHLSVVPLDTELGDRVNLTTEDGTPADDVTVTLPLPLLARAGVRYRSLVNNVERFDVELDVEYVTWSRVNRFTVDANHKVANYAGGRVNIDKINVEKHWRDTIAVRLGGDYQVLPGAFTLRAGGYYESGVAQPAYANVDFSGAAQFGGALGASVFFSRFELVAAYMLKLQPGVTVSESQGRVYQQVPGSPCLEDSTRCAPSFSPGQTSPVVNAGTYSASSHMLYLSVLYRYGL